MFSRGGIRRLFRRNRLAISVFLVSSLLTLGSWRYAVHLDKLQAELKFDKIAQDYQQDLRDRFNTYLRALIDLRGLFDSSQVIRKPEVDAFMQSINLIHDFPGITRIGYAPLVTNNEVAAFEARAWKEGLKGYRIGTPEQEEHFFPVLYAYPPANRSQTQIIGMDLARLPNRKAAMARARDINQPVVTKKIAMPSDPQGGAAIGIYLPVYRYGAAHNTLQERRRALSGFVFEGFKVGDLLKGFSGRILPIILALKYMMAHS